MTGREFVRHLARLAGYPAAEATERTNRVIAAVGMSDRADKRLAGFSKGMRQRIKLAQAMVHDPDAILLDEPLNGLDPVARREFIELLAGLAAQGKTVLVSSHILFEVEQMTRSILLLNRGRLLAAGDLSTIREILDKYPHRVRIESPQPRQLAEWAVGRSHLLSIRIDEDRDRLDLEIREPDAFYRELSDAIRSGEVSITAFHSPDNNLESIFHYLVQA
jgi:ABC-2 type transport system ATP-binding protein